MSDSPAFLADRLRSEGEKTLAFFQSLSQAQWEQVVYSDNIPWNARQVLAHLVSTEEMVRTQIEGVLSGGRGVAEDFDIDAFNLQAVARLERTSVTYLLNLFTNYRQATIALVERLRSEERRVGKEW